MVVRARRTKGLAVFNLSSAKPFDPRCGGRSQDVTTGKTL